MKKTILVSACIGVLFMGLLYLPAHNGEHQDYIARSIRTGQVVTLRSTEHACRLNLFNLGEPVHADAKLQVSPDTTLETFIILDILN